MYCWFLFFLHFSYYSRALNIHSTFYVGRAEKLSLASEQDSGTVQHTNILVWCVGFLGILGDVNKCIGLHRF